MRIGIDVRSAQDPNPTGVGRYTASLVRALLSSADAGDSFVLFTNSLKRNMTLFSELAHQTAKVHVAQRHIPNRALNASLYFLRRPFLDHLAGGTDVFFLPNLNFVSVSRRTSLVVTVHDLSFERFPHFFSRKRRIWHHMVRPRIILRRASAVITPSRRTAEDVHDVFVVPRERIHVIPSGLDQAFLEPLSHAVQARLLRELHLPSRYMLFMGAFEPRKNVSGIIAAYQRYRARRPRNGKPPASLILAGPKGWLSRDVFRAVRASPYARDIRTPGYVTDDEKRVLYEGALCVLYPSFYEGFGFQLVEAMALGRPLIAGATGSIPEVVGDAAVLVDPYNVADISSAMRAMDEDEKLRDLLIQKGKTRATQFSWQRAAKETKEVFHLAHAQFDSTRENR